MFVVAFSLGYYLMKSIFKREGVGQEKLDSLFIYAVVSILLGARLGHVIFYEPTLFKTDFFSVFLPFRFVPEFEFTGFRGLASHGAAIVTLIGMYIYNKKILQKSWLWILDRVVVPVASGAVFVRLGNFLNSEMVGRETDSAIGIRFVQHNISENEAIAKTGIRSGNKALRELTTNPQFTELVDSIPYRYPGQLMEAFGYVFVFLILFAIYWKTEVRKKPGFIFGSFLLLLMTVRIIVEQFKLPQVNSRSDWDLNTGQLLSIPFILIGLYFVITSLIKKEAQA
jgi:prolipoprotein diacylglyceryl transferase